MLQGLSSINRIVQKELDQIFDRILLLALEKEITVDLLTWLLTVTLLLFYMSF